MAKPPYFPFHDEGQMCIKFCNGCFDLSVNLLICNMVLNVQKLSVESYLHGLDPFSDSAVKDHL